MSTDERPSAMARKAGAGRPPPEIGAPTASRLLRTAIMQAGEDVAGLTIVAGQPEEGRVTLGPLIDGISHETLIAMIEGPEGRYGLVLVAPDTMAALIEIQTTGRVVPRPAAPRPPTRTDAIMCADFIDRVLELLETRVADADLDVAPALSGFRYALPLAEARAIAMTLDDVPYRRFHVPLDLGRGAKQGTLEIILPFDAAPSGLPGGQSAETSGFSEALAAVVGETEAELRGTLCRVELPLASVASFTVGSLIPIPRESLSDIGIEDIDGQTVMRGRLGMSEGHRAIRIGSPQQGQEPDHRGGNQTHALAAPPASVPQDAPPDPPEPAAPKPVDLAISGDMDRLTDLGDLGDFGGPAELGDLSDLGDLGDLSFPEGS